MQVIMKHVSNAKYIKHIERDSVDFSTLDPTTG